MPLVTICLTVYGTFAGSASKIGGDLDHEHNMARKYVKLCQMSDRLVKIRVDTLF
jgi:hypothetical protein